MHCFAHERILRFDTTVSYRPGARFGPTGIRVGSRRHMQRGYTLSWGFELYNLAKVIDCGDVSSFCVYSTLALIIRLDPAERL